MPISINWLTKTILVPKDYLVDEGNGYFAMDVNQFRLDLKDIEDGEGITFEDTHRHNTEVVLSGVTFARTFEIINGYQVEFEDDGTMNGHYTVRLYGANHNIADVKVFNSVSIVQSNSAGLQTVATGAGPTPAQVAQAVWEYVTRTLTGGVDLSTVPAAQLAEVWKLHGLQNGNPLVVSSTGRTTNDITQTVTTVGDITTVQRQ